MKHFATAAFSSVIYYYKINTPTTKQQEIEASNKLAWLRLEVDRRKSGCHQLGRDCEKSE